MIPISSIFTLFAVFAFIPTSASAQNSSGPRSAGETCGQYQIVQNANLESVVPIIGSRVGYVDSTTFEVSGGRPLYVTHIGFKELSVGGIDGQTKVVLKCVQVASYSDRFSTSFQSSRMNFIREAAAAITSGASLSFDLVRANASGYNIAPHNAKGTGPVQFGFSVLPPGTTTSGLR